MRPVLLLLACLTVAGCTAGAAAAIPTVSVDHVDGRQYAELDVTGGATTVFVRAADLGDQLYRTSAQVDVHGDLVSVRPDHSADLVIEVNSALLWRLALDGGASQEGVDFSRGRLAELDFDAGASRIVASLPRPHGTVAVRMSGGASEFTVRLPNQVDAQVVLAGGAGQANIDGSTHTGIAGGTVLSTPGWNTAVDRYTVDNTAGVSSFTLARA